MNQYYSLEIVYSLLNTVVVFAVAFLDCAMVIQARRKRLTAFLPWLVPATIAAIASCTAVVIRDSGMILGFQPAPFWFVAEYLLGAVSVLLMFISVLRLWKIVNAFTEGAGAMFAQDSIPSGSNEGIWPPPPTNSV